MSKEKKCTHDWVYDDFQGREVPNYSEISMTNMYGVYTIRSWASEPDLKNIWENLVQPLLIAIGFGQKTIDDFFDISVPSDLMKEE